MPKKNNKSHAKKIAKNIYDISSEFSNGNRYKVVFTKNGKTTNVGTYSSLTKATRNRDRALEGLSTDPSDKAVRNKADVKFPTVSKYIKDYSAKYDVERYVVSIRKDGIQMSVGTYNSLEKAILNRDRALDGLPTDKSDKLPSDARTVTPTVAKYISDESANYKSGEHYVVRMRINGRPIKVGQYMTLEKAILNRDRALRGEETDPSDKWPRQHKSMYPTVATGILDISKRYDSGKHYSAHAYYGSKDHSLGVFDTIEAAKRAQEKELERVKGENK